MKIAIASAATLIGATVAAIATHPAEADPNPTPTQFAFCEQEDGPAPCYWDADAQGNGAGVDVIHGFKVLKCGPQWTLLVRKQPMWDEGCQPDANGKPIALRLNSTRRVMGS